MQLHYLINFFIFTALLWGSQVWAGEEYDIRSSKYFQSLEKSFSESLDIYTQFGSKFLEFCPDNMCDLIEFKREGDDVSILDFSFIYIYYLSDYYVLNTWREKAEPTLLIHQVLGKKSYSSCGNSVKIEHAKCILRQLGKIYDVKIYAVRYDENERILESKVFP